MFFIDGGKILIPLVQGKLIEYLVVNKVITTPKNNFSGALLS